MSVEGSADIRTLQPRKWSVGFPVELTRVGEDRGGVDVSTVRNPQGQFETTVFRLADGDSVVPMVTETRVEALKAHEFIVGVAAQILQSQQ